MKIKQYFSSELVAHSCGSSSNSLHNSVSNYNCSYILLESQTQLSQTIEPIIMSFIERVSVTVISTNYHEDQLELSQIIT